MDALFLLVFWCIALGILHWVLKQFPIEPMYRAVVVGVFALILLILIYRALDLPTGFPR